MESFLEARLPGALSPFVESMVGYRIAGAPPGTHIGMPSGAVTLVVALDEPLDLVGADGRRGCFDTLIAGLHAAPARILHDGSQHGVQLALTPRGAALLLGGPSGEIAGTSLDLGELIGPSARRLHERLSETPDWSERFALVVDALFTSREARWQARPEVDHAWRVRAGYADQSHLNRDWLAFAGTSPTRWLREDEIAFVQDGVRAPARS